MKVIICSETRLKADTIIDNNVDTSYLYPAMQLAQEISLVEIIGTSLYERIITDIDEGTLEGDYKELVDTYIIPYLEFEIVAQIGSLLQFKYRNSGVSSNQDEHFNTAEKDMLLYLFDQNKHNASAYANRLKRELTCNSSKYPELQKDGLYNFNQKGGESTVIYFEK